MHAGGAVRGAADLKEAGHGSSSTLVPVHPGHEASGLDVGSAGVVGDALESTTFMKQAFVAP